MIREIEEKKKLLDAKKPYSALAAEKFAKLDLFDFVFSNLKLDGSILTSEGVNTLINGGLIPGVSIHEHSSIEIHRRLIKKFGDMVHMKTDIDTRELIGIYSVLMNVKNPTFRKGNLILYQLNYTPPYYQDIETQLMELFRKLFVTDYGSDFIRMAVDMHNGIIKIYPFEFGSEALARTVLQYVLFANGYPLIQFGVTEQVYNEIVGESIRKDNSRNVYLCIEDALVHKLDTMLNYFNN